VPYQNLADGLYLVTQRSAAKGVDHYGILDVGNRLRVPGADGTNPVVVHQCPPGIRADWLQDTGAWEVLGRITDEPYAVARYHTALANPAYDLFGHNCEHFARFVATGVRESKQLQAAGWIAGLATLVIVASAEERPKPPSAAAKGSTRSLGQGVTAIRQLRHKPTCGPQSRQIGKDCNHLNRIDFSDSESVATSTFSVDNA
jgi:hypothetical protein